MWKLILVCLLLVTDAVVAQDPAEDDVGPPATNLSNDTDEEPETPTPITLVTEVLTTSQPILTTESYEEAFEPCIFPSDLRGDWLSSIFKGIVTFTESVLQTEQEIVGGPLVCYNSTGTTYLLRSNNTVKDSNRVFTCISLARRNTDNYNIIVQTMSNSVEKREPVADENPEEGANTFEAYCSDNAKHWISGALIRKGKEIEGALGCPETLKGRFKMNFMGDFQKSCPNGALLSSLEEAKALVGNFSTCKGNSEFSGAEPFYCIAGGMNEVQLYSKSSEPNPYAPFSCMTVEEDDNATITGELTAFGCGGQWSPSDGPPPVEFVLESLSYNETNSTYFDLSGYNETNSTDFDLSGNDTNTTDTGSRDAASSLTAHNFLVLLIVTLLAMTLCDHFSIA